jgi:hypothetical protein
MEEYLVSAGRVSPGWVDRELVPKLNSVIREYVLTIRPFLEWDGEHDFLILGFDCLFEDLWWGLSPEEIQEARLREGDKKEDKLVLEGGYRVWLGEIQNPPGMVTPKELYDVLVPEIYTIVDEIHDLKDEGVPRDRIAGKITSMKNWMWVFGGEETEK